MAAQTGPGPGWLVVLVRDRGYINPRTGEIRDEVTLPEGYAEAACWLGLRRVKTIWEWLRNDLVARFVREISHENGVWEEFPWFFKVCMGEPMTEEDRVRANELLARRGIGVVGTIRRELIGHPVGTIDTISGAVDTIRDELNGHPVGAVDTIRHDPIGAVDTISGAVDTIRDESNGHSVGAVDTIRHDPIGAIDTISGAVGTNLGAVTPILAQMAPLLAQLTPLGLARLAPLIGANGTI